MAEVSNQLDRPHGGSETQRIDSESYEELLNRYERVLVYAGQLQEKARQGRLLEERSRSLARENQRLQALVGVDQAYIRLLERALERLDILKPGDVPEESKMDV